MQWSEAYMSMYPFSTEREYIQKVISPFPCHVPFKNMGPPHFL